MRRNFTQIIILTTLQWASLALPGQEKATHDSIWTLEACIQLALDQNIQVRQSNLYTHSDEVNLESARGQRFPSLDFSYRYSNSWSKPGSQSTGEEVLSLSSSNTYNLNSSVTLFDGFAITNRIRQAELNLESGRYYSETIKESISLNVLNAFLQVLFAEEQVKNTRQQIEATVEQLFLAEQRLNLEVISRSDYLQVKSQLASEKLSNTNAVSQLAIAKVNLMQLMEMEVTDDFRIAHPDLEQFLNQQRTPDAPRAYQQALAVKPQVKRVELDKESAMLDEKIAKAGYFPSLSLSAGVGTNYYNLDETPGYLDQLTYKINPTIGLTLSVPIFQKFQVKSSTSQAKIGIENAELNEIDIRNQLRKEIEQACVDITSAQSEYEASLEQYESNVESHDLATEKFQQGMINSVDYLFEKTNLIVAESQLLQSKYSLIFSYKVMDFFSGIPISL